MNRSKRANHFGTICEKRITAKRRFDLERSSWHDATFQNGTPVRIKSTMLEHSDGQPGNFKVYRAYHRRLHQNDGWYCFVVYRPHGRTGCTIVDDRPNGEGGEPAHAPVAWWWRSAGTDQAKLAISGIF